MLLPDSNSNCNFETSFVTLNFSLETVHEDRILREKLGFIPRIGAGQDLPSMRLIP